MSDVIDTRPCWTKEQTAAELQRSTKAVERYVQAGKLPQHWREQKGSPDLAVYFPDDVAHLKAELAARRRRGPSGGVLVPGPTLPSNGTGRDDGNLHLPNATSALTTIQTGVDNDPLRAFAAAVYAAVMSQTSQTSAGAQTLYVTVSEAAAILGLPQADVRRLIHDGDLNHRLTGRGGIRIRRKDLEAL